VRVVEELETKQRFFEMLMAKYGKSDWAKDGEERPKSFFPRIDQITLYALTIERMTGKETPLPDIAERWPSVDRTKTPNARPS
jgi:hypothetical protein